MTSKQEFARERNFIKLRITGTIYAHFNYRSKYFTNDENEIMKSISELQERLLEEFDNESVKLGLNVIPKCLCGKRRKTPCEEYCYKINKT